MSSTEFILCIGIAIGIYIIAIKYILKESKKMETERLEKERLLSLMTEKERKEYEKKEAKNTMIGEILYAISTMFY